MVDFIVRPHTIDDDPQIVALGNLLGPEYPEQTVEEYRRFIDLLPPEVRHRRLVAMRDGEFVGHSFLAEMFWVTESGRFTVQVEVHPAHQGRGIGEALYAPLLDTAREFGAQRLYGNVREDRPEARRFAAKHGLSDTGHISRNSRLDVHQPTWEGYDGLEEQLGREGIHVKALAELGPQDDDVLRAIHRVQVETARDEPGSEEFGIAFEQWRDLFLTSPGMSPESVWVALDGSQMVGLTAVRRQGSNAGWHNGMGVVRAYRGRGIARLLKMKTIRWAQQNGVDYLFTGNDVDNPRMYAINMRLGYQPLPGVAEVVRDLSGRS